MAPQTLTHHGINLTYQATIHRKRKFKHYLYITDDGIPCYLKQLPADEKATSSSTVRGFITQATLFVFTTYLFAKKLNLLS